MFEKLSIPTQDFVLMLGRTQYLFWNPLKLCDITLYHKRHRKGNFPFNPLDEPLLVLKVQKFSTYYTSEVKNLRVARRDKSMQTLKTKHIKFTLLIVLSTVITVSCNALTVQ